MNQNSFTQQFEFLLKFAKEQLSKHGEFYPFASVVEADGQIRSLASLADDDRPHSGDIIADLDRTISYLINNKSIISAAICVNGSKPFIKQNEDAIVIEIENAAGEAATVLVPYKGQQGHLQYSDPVVYRRAPKWFATQSI
jgi:hypothetical protein